MQESNIISAQFLMRDNDGVFECQEETLFYSVAVQYLCFNLISHSCKIDEFGTGNGIGIIKALQAQQNHSPIISYEVCKLACREAKKNIKEAGLEDKYIIRCCDYLNNNEAINKAEWLIVNPPYLPAPDNNIMLPSLWGGRDGNTVIKQLVSLGYANLLIIVSSYSNPADTLSHIQNSGYIISDWMGTPLSFGEYTKENKVFHQISMMKKKGKAFFDETGYKIAALRLQKQSSTNYMEQVFDFLTHI